MPPLERFAAAVVGIDHEIDVVVPVVAGRGLSFVVEKVVDHVGHRVDPVGLFVPADDALGVEVREVEIGSDAAHRLPEIFSQVYVVAFGDHVPVAQIAVDDRHSVGGEPEGEVGHTGRLVRCQPRAQGRCKTRGQKDSRYFHGSFSSLMIWGCCIIASR